LVLAAADLVSTSSGVDESNVPPALRGDCSIGLVVFASAEFMVLGRKLKVFSGELSKSARR
jgi:hypothetical protein